MINLLLLIIAISILVPIGTLGFFYSVISKMLKAASIYFWQIAVAIDKLGNIICQDLFNDLMVKPGGYRFGNGTETVSYVLGVNKANDNLYIIGRALSAILNWIDKSHVEDAVKNRKTE